jgi:hypothetical protein
MLNIKIKEIIYLINLSARASGSLGRRQACDGAAAGARHNYVENALSLTLSAAAVMQQQQQQQKCWPPRAAKTVENSLFGSVNVGKLQEKKLWSGFLPLCGFGCCNHERLPSKIPARVQCTTTQFGDKEFRFCMAT